MITAPLSLGVNPLVAGEQLRYAVLQLSSQREAFAPTGFDGVPEDRYRSPSRTSGSAP
ncbi:hypothetical protein J2W14_004252 [Pseudarthrobacter oxydans]|uniref:hypothetical protein n=1 Tax=Pseudarthrobacter oxydans TaxID=1671 RepID=UPI002786ABD6|nr:hypothetical protein [Pseudarthrobacter oxydans]MDP9984825.1 hypothetical protein [Pseudarthrobacter oxydans]